MHIVTQQRLKQAAEKYPDAARQVAAWRAIAIEARWRSFDDVKHVFTDADQVGDYVVFGIGGNRYRLVTIIQFPGETKDRAAEGHIWIRSFLNNRQYGDPANWNKGVLP